MRAEELRQERDDLAVQYDRKRQQADKMPDNTAVQWAAHDAHVAFLAVENRLLRHVVQLLKQYIERHKPRDPQCDDSAPLKEKRR